MTAPVNRCGRLHGAFAENFMNSKFSGVTLVVCGERILAHKIVLSNYVLWRPALRPRKGQEGACHKHTWLCNSLLCWSSFRILYTTFGDCIRLDGFFALILCFVASWLLPLRHVDFPKGRLSIKDFMHNRQLLINPRIEMKVTNLINRVIFWKKMTHIAFYKQHIS